MTDFSPDGITALLADRTRLIEHEATMRHSRQTHTTIHDADAIVEQMVYALPDDVDLGDEREVIAHLRLCEFQPDEIAALLDRVIDETRAMRARTQTVPGFLGGVAGNLLCLGVFVGFIALLCPGFAHAAEGPVESSSAGYLLAVLVCLVLAGLAVMLTRREVPSQPEDFDSAGRF